MTIKERFNLLIQDFSNGNKKAFAEMIGVSPTVIENIVGKREGNPSFEVLRKLKFAIANLNTDWLLAGGGSMLITERKEATALISAEDENAIYLYDVSASAGFGSFDEMISKEKVIGKYVVPDFRNIDWMIYVKGSSMYPKYSSGDIIACRVLRESRFIQWGKVYVVATREQGILVKCLEESEDKECLKAISDNPSYKPFNVPKDEIIGIALVVGVIRME